MTNSIGLLRLPELRITRPQLWSLDAHGKILLAKKDGILNATPRIFPVDGAAGWKS